MQCNIWKWSWRLAHTRGSIRGGACAKRMISLSSVTSNNSNNNSAIEVKRVRKLMRLIYSKAHPDLFTNYSFAQKQNENSLKILRNLSEAYVAAVTEPSKMRHLAMTTSGADTSNFQSSNEQLVFFVKQIKADDEKQTEDLKRIQISKLASSGSTRSIEKNIAYIFNQFIDTFHLPIEKFDGGGGGIGKSNEATTPTPKHQQWRWKKHVRSQFAQFDDDGDDGDDDIDDDEDAPSVKIDLQTWVNENRSSIENKLSEARQISQQLEANKALLVQKWKLKDILFKSNWSLKHFNSYMLALNSSNLAADTDTHTDTLQHHFEGFVLVMTNDNVPGLRRSGHIHLDCSQVYSQWLDVLHDSRKKASLLAEIAHMESRLSRLLYNIRVCEALVATAGSSSGDESLIELVAYYHRTLSKVLDKFDSQQADLLRRHQLGSHNATNANFSHLKLVVQNVATHKINEAGQFIIGATKQINYANTLDFIANNRQQAERMYKEYTESVEKISRAKSDVELRLSSPVELEPSLSAHQRLTGLLELNARLIREPSLLLTMRSLGTTVMIGSTYGLNESDGSIKIPWNFYEATAAASSSSSNST